MLKIIIHLKFKFNLAFSILFGNCRLLCDSRFTFHTMEMKWQGKKSNKVATVCLKRSGLSQIKALVLLQPSFSKSYGIFGAFFIFTLIYVFAK